MHIAGDRWGSIDIILRERSGLFQILRKQPVGVATRNGIHAIAYVEPWLAGNYQISKVGSVRREDGMFELQIILIIVGHPFILVF